MVPRETTLLAFRSRKGNEIQDTEELETIKANERMGVQLTLQILWEERAMFCGNSISVVL